VFEVSLVLEGWYLEVKDRRGLLSHAALIKPIVRELIMRLCRLFLLA
jgi:hypothetical protein